jgi:hypothetical protein
MLRQLELQKQREQQTEKMSKILRSWRIILRKNTGRQFFGELSKLFSSCLFGCRSEIIRKGFFGGGSLELICKSESHQMRMLLDFYHPNPHNVRTRAMKKANGSASKLMMKRR